jgi:hypothetical protein
MPPLLTLGCLAVVDRYHRTPCSLRPQPETLLVMDRVHGDEASARNVEDQVSSFSKLPLRWSEEKPSGDRPLVGRVLGSREKNLAGY